ncbi:MAG: hypothetical protein AAF570_15425, partial [Bacteroidota bacterium]
QGFYLLQTDMFGNPGQFSYYEDSSSFLLSGPRGYGLCYDGEKHFYFAVGSNDNQLLIKTDTTGEMDWVVKVNHHDFYSIICEGTHITALGQDESLLGLHDFSVVQADTNGTISTAGMMYGTAGFEGPEEMMKVPGGYLMVGSSFGSGFFNSMVVKANPDLSMKWGFVYEGAGRDMIPKTLAVPPDGKGYLFGGYSPGNGAAIKDSVWIMRTDTFGNPQWMMHYGIDSSTNASALTMDVDPETGDILLGGEYKKPGFFRRPYVMKTDSLGVLQWIRDYGDPDTMTEEIVQDITISQDGEFFYALAEHVQIDTSNRVFRRIVVIRATLEAGELPCDSALTVGQSMTLPNPMPVVFTEPFLVQTTYPIGEMRGSMESVFRCSVYVMANVFERPEIEFGFVNPAQSTLQVDYDAGIDGAVLDLRDVQGRMMGQYALAPGRHRRTFDIAHMPQGIYFLTVRGEGWRSETKRLLILR